MPHSLLRQLLLIWLVIVAACIGLGIVLAGLYRHTEGVRAQQAEQQLGEVCSRMVQRFNGASDEARGSDGIGLAAVVSQLVLADAQGVEGGIWDNGSGLVAYAYPTYEGSERKTDVPSAERARIEQTAAASVSAGHSVLQRHQGQRETTLLLACPLDRSRAAWSMTRVATGDAAASLPLALGAGLILALVLVSAGSLGWVVHRWRKRLNRIEQALTHTGPVPDIPVTGAAELDRLAASVRDYAQRNARALAESQRLGEALARHERLATLGRLTATVAHEIRTPIATLRLALENHLSRPDHGLGDEDAHLMLAQMERLDGVVESLLGMVQPIRLRRETVTLRDWLPAVAAEAADGVATAAALPVQLALDNAPDTWVLDRHQAARALLNLVRNALQHAQPASPVVIGASRGAEGEVVCVDVRNHGAPVPAAVAGHLFEPFVTGRAEGHGLGLSLASEIARAHGGCVRYAHQTGITTFTLELPWRAS